MRWVDVDSVWWGYCWVAVDMEHCQVVVLAGDFDESSLAINRHGWFIRSVDAEAHGMDAMTPAFVEEAVQEVPAVALTTSLRRNGDGQFWNTRGSDSGCDTDVRTISGGRTGGSCRTVRPIAELVAVA